MGNVYVLLAAQEIGAKKTTMNVKNWRRILALILAITLKGPSIALVLLT